MTISATKFKAQCLSLMDRVNRTKRPLSITKRGKVVARLFPGGETRAGEVAGPMAELGSGLDAVYGYARRLRKTPRTTEEWMRELREGERD
jgi:prevent-host-death family protein